MYKNNQSDNTTIAVLIIIFVLCLAFTGAGVYMSFFSTRGYVKTKALITQIESDYGASDSPSYTVHVEYVVDGQLYAGISDVHVSGYKTGKRIDIYYNPDNPTEFHGDVPVVGYFFTGIGGVSCLFSLIMLASAVKARKEPE